MNRLTIAAVMGLAYACPVFSQSAITNYGMVREGRNVRVEFDVNAQATEKNRREILMPYLYSGKDTVWLPAVEVFGRQAYKRARQEQALAGNGTWSLSDRQTVSGSPLSYSAVTSYRKWMKSSSLGLKRVVSGCGCEEDGGNTILVAGRDMYVAPEPVFSGNVTENASDFSIIDARRKWDFGKKEVEIYFRVAKTDLNLEEFGNAESMGMIINAISSIMADRKSQINSIEITGFASPEGSRKLNEELGIGRANSLMEYLKNAGFGLEDEDFSLRSGDENWQGLAELLEASDKPYREEALHIIRNTSGAERKAELRKLGGGQPYRDMLESIYPQLRNACYIAVYYDVLGDAAADEINKANAMARDGKYAEALEMLGGHMDDPRAFNTIGVCLMMLEREEEAEIFFRKAIGNGDEAAAENLKQIDYITTKS